MSDQAKGPEGMVRERFDVRQFFALPDGELEFEISYTEKSGAAFASLAAELKPLGFRPELSGSSEECVLTVRRVQPPKAQPRLPVFLVFFTLAAVVVFALLQEFVYGQLAPQISPYVAFFEFAAPVAVVMGVHEVAQRTMARRRHGGKASSYLIPGIPYVTSFLPSLGFLSSQREPALNRDALFDTVIVGPVAMLVLAVAFYAVGEATAVSSSIPFVGSQVANSTITINPGLIQAAISSAVLRPVAAGYIPISPLADGAAIGFMLAFIGFLPMVSFDGGYLSNLVWGASGARAANYLSVVALLVLDMPNYWALAVVVLVLAGRPFQTKLMDDVSPLSASRRWLFALTLVLAVLCVPLPQNLATIPLP